MSRCHKIATCLAVGLMLLTTTVTWGQRGRDRGGGGEGARGDERGRGGPQFGRGGGGGPPMMGRGGGGPMMSRGGSGGPPMMGGGFDPTFILRRMDRNQNGQLDPDEIDDRAKFMINRFAPDVDLSKPVKIEAIAKSVQARTGGGAPNRGGSSNEAPVIAALVPGFGEELDVVPIPGFGDLAALFDVETTEKDEEEAANTLRRYDRDKDGMLDSRELRSGRWSDDPLQYDVNGDGSLSKMELVLRYAIRRVSREGSSSGNDKKSDGDRRNENEKDKKRDEGDSRNSYRFMTAHERLPKGTPDWFIEKDVDQDGQVTMFEYASQWNDSTANEFLGMDRDGNGILTVPESLADEGEEATSSASGTASNGTPTVSKTSTASTTKGTSSGSVSDKYLNYARSMVKKYDTDGNGFLSSREAAATRHKPSDWNGDGKITVEEYARHLMPK